MKKLPVILTIISKKHPTINPEKDSKDKSKISDNNDDVNEDEADEEIGIQKLRNKIQTPMRKTKMKEATKLMRNPMMTEMPNSSDNEEEEESEDNNEGDEDEERAADSADDNIKSDSRKRRLRQRDFLEEEAELSGSDDGGADDVDNPEDGDSLDQALAAELEGMIDDDEDALGGRSKVRRQVARIQHAMETDEDRRRLDQLKELLLPDGELADESDADGGVRKWRFNRWKELQERRDAAEAAARAGLEDACWGDGRGRGAAKARGGGTGGRGQGRAGAATAAPAHAAAGRPGVPERLSITAQHPNQHHQHLLEDSSSQQSQFFRDMHARLVAKSAGSGGGGDSGLKAAVAAAAESKVKSSTGVACFSVQSRKSASNNNTNTTDSSGRKRVSGLTGPVANGNQPAAKKLRQTAGSGGLAASPVQQRRSSIFVEFLCR
uniref:MFAP1 domain-containing protein n=1 Tax=Macrostomum lignano TaxID=282301 RepID=A0A1I8FCZ9_9PLAT